MGIHFHGWKRHALICGLALSSSLPVLAAEPTASMAQVAEQAWRRHPQAAGRDARDSGARAIHQMAGAVTPEPAAISLSNLNDRQGRNQGQQEWELELAVPLWLPGQKAARMAEADSRTGEAVARLAVARLEVADQVRRAWWSLATARSARTLALRRLEMARALNGAVQRRFSAGDLSRIDANLAQADLLAAESEITDAGSSLLQAEQVFQLLSGGVAPASLNEEAIFDGAAADPQKPDQLHPQLALAAAAARSARARMKLADSTRRSAPELALRVVRERGNATEPYGNQVGVRLKIPLSSGAQVGRDLSLAQAESEQADAEMRLTEERVRIETGIARSMIESAEQQLTLAKKRNDLAGDNLRLTEKSFALGEADLTTLLRVRGAAFEADSIYERLRLTRAAAISRLNQALGALP